MASRPRKDPSRFERVDLRTSSSRTFQESDGTFVSQVYRGNVFYQPEGSAGWQPIDLSFSPSTHDGANAVVTDSPVQVALSAADSPNGFARLTAKGQSIALRIPTSLQGPGAGSAPVLGSDGRSATYQNALSDGIDLLLAPRADGITTLLVLHHAPAATSYTFAVEGSGVNLKTRKDGSVALIAASGEVIGRLPRPYMLDSSGRYSDNVSMSIGRSKSSPTITITPDRRFLAEATYPVYLDPTVTGFPADAGTTEDASFSSSNYYDGVYSIDYDYPYSLRVGPWSDRVGHEEAPEAYTTLIRFDGLEEALGDVEVDGASLVVNAWDQNADPAEVWITQAPSWTSLVGDDPESAEVTAGYGSFDLTNTVQAWLDGSVANEGVYLDSSARMLLVASEDVSGYGPLLEVTWHMPVESRGDESYLTRVPFDLGGGWRMAVGVHNGQLTLSRGLFQIPSYGPAQGMDLTYSSLDPGSNKLGVGWSSNLTQHLEFEGTEFAYWHRADAGVQTFKFGGSTWAPDAAHHETLTHSSGEYTVTLKDQTTLVFEDSGSGRLKRITNRYGKSLTLNWAVSPVTATDASSRHTDIALSSGRISSVTDSAGRAWTFGYTSGYLTSLTDAESAVTTFGYTSGLLTSITRSRSRVSGSPQTITWTIDYTSGKVTGVKDPINTSVANTFSYSSGSTTVGLLKEYSGPVRNTSVYTLDEFGRVTEMEDPDGYTTTYTFDSASNLTDLELPVTTTDSQLITYAYDAAGNMLSQETQLDATTTVTTVMTYNSTNDMLVRSDADGTAIQSVTRYTYSGGHLASVDVNCTSSSISAPSPGISCTGSGTADASHNLLTNYTYTTNGQLETETDPRSIVSKHVYDTYGNETSTIRNYLVSGSDADENVTTSFAFDSGTTAGKAGLVTSVTDPRGNETTYEYDDLGRQTAESLPGDASIPATEQDIAYDELGNFLTETDGWTGISPRVISHVYDLANRETVTTDASGVARTTTYDAAGNAVAGGAGGVTTVRTFDGRGNVVSEGVGSDQTTHAYDGRGNKIETVDPDGVDTLREYDLGGRLVAEAAVVNGPDLVTSHEYDLLGRETQLTEDDGAVTTTSYDGAGRVNETIEAGATTDYQYDRGGNEIEKSAPDGTVTTTAYDDLDRPTTVIVNDVVSPSAATEDVTSTTYYDEAGNVVATVDPSGVVTRTVTNVRGVIARAISNCTDTGSTPESCDDTGETHDEEHNVVSRAEFDGSGAALESATLVDTSLESTAAFAYDDAGRLIAVRDQAGTVTRTFYDSHGRDVKIVVNCTDDISSPAPPSSFWESCAGTGVADGTWNLTTTRTYDSHGNLDTQTAPNGRLTKYLYSDGDRLLEQIDNYVTGTPGLDQNLTTYYAYDDAGRQIAVRSPTADRSTFAVSAYVYDSTGHLESEVNNCTMSGTTPPADPAWKSCTGAGTHDDETNITTSYEYDGRGNRVALTAPDPDGSGDVTTRYAYDDMHRLCGVLENATVSLASPDPCATPSSTGSSSNIWTTYAYDGLGDMTAMTDGNGHITTYGFDASERMTTVTDAEGGTTTCQFDDLGRRIIQSERGIGSEPTLVSWTYDEAGRIATRVTSDGTTSYEYDVMGNMVSASLDANGSAITVTYDRLNRPITVDVTGDSGASTGYTYDLFTPSWTDPSGSYTAQLDAFGRQIGLTDPLHGSDWTFAYRADGQLAQQDQPNGNTLELGYDDAGRLASSTTLRSSGAFWSRAEYAWTLNAAGQILSEDSEIADDSANGTTSYSFDSLGRLTSFTNPASSSTAYGWNGVPDRTSVQVDAGTPTTYSFDDANRLTADSVSGSYAFDDEGRLTARPGQTLTWNDLGQLIAVKDATGTTTIASYTYDALDRLLTIDHPGSDSEELRYVGLTPHIAQVDGTTSYSIYNDVSGNPLFTFDGSNEAFLGFNAHHDVTWTADDTGAVSGVAHYDPWGAVTASSGVLPDLGFQSSWYDGSVDLSWAAARWYAPQLGRFVSEDSAAPAEPHLPASRHLYAYGAGDPIDHWDPNGHYWASVRANETFDQLARRTLGGPNLWPMIWNANRVVYRNEVSGSTVMSAFGGCAYVPTNWLATQGQRTSWDRANQCSHSYGSSYRTLTAFDFQNVLDGQRTAGIGSTLGVFSFTRSALYDATKSTTRRSPNPGDPSDNEWSLIRLRVAPFNQRAKDVIRTRGYTGIYAAYEWLPATWISGGEGPWYCHGNPCTVGEYIFTNDNPRTMALLSHEYIHVLQYEGRGQAYEDSYTRYAVYSAACAETGSHCYEYANNPEESVAYLWGNWIKYFGHGEALYEQPAFEKVPWRIWVRPTHETH